MKLGPVHLMAHPRVARRLADVHAALQGTVAATVKARRVQTRRQNFVRLFDSLAGFMHSDRVAKFLVPMGVGSAMNTIRYALEIHRNVYLEVAIVSHGASNSRIRKLAAGSR